MTPVAVVTGSSTGVGQAIARRLAAQGVVVRGISRRDRPAEGAFQTVQGDVTDAQAMRDLAQTVETEVGPVTILIHAATIHHRQDFLTARAEDVCRPVQVNLCGRINVTAAFLPGMVAQGRGRIVTIARPVPQPPLPGNLGFAAAQAGADTLSRTLAVEVGIRLPGIVVTEWVPALDMEHDPDLIAGLGASLALNDDPALHGATVLGDRQILPGRSLRRRVLDLLLLKPAARPIVLAQEPTRPKETT
ncbi:SDR family NAD(P)-dependent oxidoreductase [Paracoccus sp. Ld10]|uniref:SDR family NAD(P)-dependent oxidoreductase n=1 Tax=Paracoccus sp. Ld10 TaxID=649158 RepID=UPI00386C7831